METPRAAGKAASPDNCLCFPGEFAYIFNEMSPNTQTLAGVQADLIDEFQFFDDWMDRYQYLIDMGRKLPEFKEEWRNDANRVHGCQSQVWLRAEGDVNRLHFDAISDSAIVSGLIAILLRIYNDRSASEILMTPPDFISGIGLDAHLSPTRSNGLHAMLKAIKAHAARLLGKTDDSE
jgi:cysteine desulfuration protein SufE